MSSTDHSWTNSKTKALQGTARQIGSVRPSARAKAPASPRLSKPLLLAFGSRRTPPLAVTRRGPRSSSYPASPNPSSAAATPRTQRAQAAARARFTPQSSAIAPDTERPIGKCRWCQAAASHQHDGHTYCCAHFDELIEHCAHLRINLARNAIAPVPLPPNGPTTHKQDEWRPPPPPRTPTAPGVQNPLDTTPAPGV
jgi:hypothetical protein